MESKRDRVFQIVRDQLVELNSDSRFEFLAEVSETTPIYGSKNSIDSLTFVSFAVGLEEAIADRFDSDIVLTDAVALANESNPFSSVQRLVDFIVARLEA